ncbi:hypothetical protein AVEN_46784-1 [Araneus ventricosus]|uniref:Uncharacterized protein n=1 Tax=Araneus ventricosus TaxID=182803 RepID=A0A4Y2S562_ARAVE|nr:hypothetical protein AVEN_25544-1 [Araneus ventricosus]GBN82759.1 hypothetical protein AVEN_46784-1 [Araneus ventricosus]
MPFVLSPVFSAPILIEKYKHAIHLISKRTLTLNEGRGSDLLSLSTSACQSLFDFPQSADFNLCYPRSEVSLLKALFFSLASFMVPLKRDFKLQRYRSDFSPDGIPTITSHLADFHRIWWLFSSRVPKYPVYL